MQVSAWMTPKPVCVAPGDMLDQVEAVMERGRFRRAPVVDAAGKLIGMITDHDLREHKGYLASTRVSAAMVEPALAVGPDEPIERAAQIMLERRIGGLPVVDAQQTVLGIITLTDIVRGLLHGMSGGEAGTGRIDFHFATSDQTFADAVAVVESNGAAVLGLGTLRDAQDGSRTFFLRVAAPRVEEIAAALRAKGFAVTAVHGPAAN